MFRVVCVALCVVSKTHMVGVLGVWCYVWCIAYVVHAVCAFCVWGFSEFLRIL